MGRTITPKYRLEVKANTNMTHLVWNGKVTDAILAEHIKETNKSFMPNGVNAHVSKAIGFVAHISGAKVIQQSTGKVVATWTAPMFQVM